MPLPKPYKRCGNKFLPKTSSGKLCPECLLKARKQIAISNKKRLAKLKKLKK